MKKFREKFSWLKFFSGFNIFNGVALAKIIQQVIVILIVIAIAVGIWYKMFGQRTQKTVQHAQTITNVTKSDEGFSLIKIKILGWGN